MDPATREDAEKAASLLLTLQQMEKELTSRLKEWVKLNGPVTVGNMVYGPKEAVSYDLDPEVITMTLLGAGLSRKEVWSLLSINKTALERGLRKLRRKDLVDWALSFGAVKISEKIEYTQVRMEK